MITKLFVSVSHRCFFQAVCGSFDIIFFMDWRDTNLVVQLVFVIGKIGGGGEEKEECWKSV